MRFFESEDVVWIAVAFCIRGVYVRSATRDYAPCRDGCVLVSGIGCLPSWPEAEIRFQDRLGIVETIEPK